MQNKRSAGLLALEAPYQISSNAISCCTWFSGRRKGKLFLYPKSTSTSASTSSLKANSVLLIILKLTRLYYRKLELCHTFLIFLQKHNLPVFLLSKRKFQKLILLVLFIHLLQNYICCPVSGLFHKRTHTFLKGEKKPSASQEFHRNPWYHQVERCIKEEWTISQLYLLVPCYQQHLIQRIMLSDAQQQKPSDQG